MFEKIKRFFGIKQYTPPMPSHRIDYEKWEEDFKELDGFIKRVFAEPAPEPTEEDIANEDEECQ